MCLYAKADQLIAQGVEEFFRDCGSIEFMGATFTVKPRKIAPSKPQAVDYLCLSDSDQEETKPGSKERIEALRAYYEGNMTYNSKTGVHSGISPFYSSIEEETELLIRSPEFATQVKQILSE